MIETYWRTGVGGFKLAAVMNIGEGWIRAELYVSGDSADNLHDRIEGQKEEIERELGYRLEWGDQLPSARDRRISRYRRKVQFADESEWPVQHRWMAKSLNDMHRVLAQRISDL